jgi:hypothetical protein
MKKVTVMFCKVLSRRLPGQTEESSKERQHGRNNLVKVK